jgi:hypothetical protein
MKTSFKIVAAFLLLTAISFQAVQSQTFEDYKKKRQQELEKYKEERSKQMQQLADEFAKYVEEQDREYADYLKEQWEKFEAFQGIAPPADPKPEEAPVFEEPEEPEKPLPLNPIPTIVPPAPEPPDFTPEPILPRIVKPEPESFPTFDKEFDFYGFPIEFDYDENMAKIRLSGNPDEEAIGNIFSELSATNYNDLLSSFYEYADVLNLNDWGYYRLLSDASAKIVGPDENTQKLFTWFLMIRSGYKAKVAYYGNEVFLLLPFHNQVYDVKYFKMGGLKYYLIDGDITNIYTYEKDFPDAQKLIDLNIYKTLSLGDESVAKLLTFSVAGEETEVPVAYNRNLIDFYKDYPLADIKVYFDAMVSPEAKNSMARAFLPIIDNKSELEAANMLLHFVQSGFDYQTDQEQFGYEKFFFAEEAFFYPYCDCEDRSVLFAYMVQNLLGLEVIGLNYPGHMATAVCFNEDVAGDFFEFEGKKFVVCDPTYIGAPVGLTMPEYKNDEAEIVVLANRYSEGRQRDYLWDDIIAAGGSRGDNGRDMILNSDGSKIFTGFYTGTFNFGSLDVVGNEKPSMFTMLVDAAQNPVWIASGSGNGTSIAYNLAKSDDDIYVTGTFQGEMELDGSEIKSTADNPDIFLAKFSKTGELKWLKNANIDTANQDGDNYLNFVSRFSSSGEHLSNELYFESGDFENYGISFGSADEVIVAGAFNKTTGMNVKSMSFDSGGEFDAVEALKAENDKLVSENYEKTIAGLFAVVNLVQSSGVSIPGSAARDVLDKYNPQFKKEYPEIYETILKVEFIANKDGVVSLRTENGKEMTIDMMRVKNNAQLKVSMLENGDAKIDVLSGIRVGKAFWWYDLNHIIMYKENGNLLFDYDVDNEVAVKNLKIDILY